MENHVNPLLKEAFVFRPIHNGVAGIRGLRYANGTWIPDDGEYDMAFIIENCAYYVGMPSYSNLLWSWSDLELTKKWLPDNLRKHAKAWHEMTVDDTPLSPEYSRFVFHNDDKHPNAIVGRLAMDKCCSINHCASGKGASITDAQYDIGKYLQANPYIKRGLLRIQRTMQPVVLPDKLNCYLCMDNGKGHLIQALQDYKDDLESDIEYAQTTINKAQANIYDAEDTIEQAKEELPKVEAQLKELGVTIEPSKDSESEE